MNLHSPHFEKALRGLVRQTVRSSPELKLEAKKSRPKREPQAMMLRLAASAGLAAAVVWIANHTNHPASSLAVINLWVFGASCFHAQRLWQHLYKSRDLAALFLLPVSDELIFRWEFQKFLREVYPVCLDATVALSALCWVFHCSLLSWLAVIPTAALLCATCIALALLCAVWMPRIVYQMITLGGIGLGITMFFARETVAVAVFSMFDRYASDLNLFLPSGWPVSLFQLTFANPRWISLWTLPLALLLVATFKNSRNRLMPGVGFREITFDEAPDIIPDDHPDAAELAEARERPVEEKPHRVGLTTIREFIESRQFLAMPQWPAAGWFEQRLWQWFNDREKRLNEFAFPHGFAIGHPWRIAYRNLLIAAALAFAVGTVSPLLKIIVILVGIFVTVCQALFQMQSGAAFRGIFCSGVNIPIYAAFAVGFRELAGMLFKCATIQLPLLIPFAAICGMLVANILDAPLLYGLMAGCKGGLLFFASRYIFLTFSFSSGTNDNQAFRLRTATMFLSLIFGGLLFLFLVGLSFGIPDESIAWIFPILAIPEAYLVFRLYGWFYHRNRFDLMRAN